MKMYYVKKYTTDVQEIEVESKTKRFVQRAGVPFKDKIETDLHFIAETFEQAKEWLIKKAQFDLSAIEHQKARAKQRFDDVSKLTEHDIRK